MSTTRTEILISGSSDDIVLLEFPGGVPEFEEIDSYNRDTVFLLKCPDGSAKIRVAYNEDGCWGTTVTHVDEDTPWPTGLEITVGVEHVYSTRTTLRHPGEMTLEKTP